MHHSAGPRTRHSTKASQAPASAAVRCGAALAWRPLHATWRVDSPPDSRRAAFLELALAQGQT